MIPQTYKGDPIINKIKHIIDTEEFRNKVMKTYTFTLKDKEKGNPDIMFNLLQHYFLEVSNVTRDIMVDYINEEIKKIEVIYEHNKVDACLDTILLLKKLNEYQL